MNMIRWKDREKDMNGSWHIEAFTDEKQSLRAALQAIGAPGVLASQKRILIKPNLINDSPPPVTVPVSAVEALITLIREWSGAEILIGEGVGSATLETPEVFQTLGYETMARHLDITLIDLNSSPLSSFRRKEFHVFPEIRLPQILFESFVISFAALKAHSLAAVTLSMKNMIGCAPPSHYQAGGHWKKSAFHGSMHRAIFELNCYRAPDLSLIDGRTGLAEYHLGGAECDPPVRKWVAGLDPVAVDAAGARLLGVDWKTVDHICMADGVLGQASL